jgi:hypothetical protein
MAEPSLHELQLSSKRRELAGALGKYTSQNHSFIEFLVIIVGFMFFIAG